jgi:hypothetical protein
MVRARIARRANTYLAGSGSADSRVSHGHQAEPDLPPAGQLDRGSTQPMVSSSRR